MLAKLFYIDNQARDSVGCVQYSDENNSKGSALHGEFGLSNDCWFKRCAFARLSSRNWVGISNKDNLGT